MPRALCEPLSASTPAACISSKTSPASAALPSSIKLLISALYTTTHLSKLNILNMSAICISEHGCDAVSTTEPDRLRRSPPSAGYDVAGSRLRRDPYGYDPGRSPPSAGYDVAGSRLRRDPHGYGPGRSPPSAGYDVAGSCLSPDPLDTSIFRSLMRCYFINKVNVKRKSRGKGEEVECHHRLPAGLSPERTICSGCQTNAEKREGVFSRTVEA
ncbi:hypothetical protein CYMTET_46863 [Cymbomonas tetramitiformis]|uniref:Uncharacterized protein n=1 Tax=Cymbomonas tetramitiformis TaxID=36881 RepID=A0AAE0BWW0_9CHLO|nr:hypothetical protein CYMTET_46863 [Cymbomonas tetramitiformis]